MNILINIAITALTIIATTFGVVNYMPMNWLGFSNEPVAITGNFGAFTDLNSTDTMSDFPTLYNANLDKSIEVGTTSVKSIITLSGLTTATSLVSVGALASGSLTTGFTAVPVVLGGTGLTSPTQYLTIIGNGAYGLTVASSTGTAGQFLTSNGVGAYPSWQSSTVNQTASYNWTGLHSFAATTTVAGLVASSTADKPIKLNNVNYNFPPTETASSTALMTNGSGSLSWNYLDWQEIAATTTTYATTSIMISNIPTRKDLKIIITGNIPTENTFNLQFNGDSTATYGYRQFENYIKTAEESNAGTSITLVVSTSSMQYLIAEVHNESGTRKLVNWHGSANSTATVIPTMVTGTGVWNNTTAQINKIYIYSTGIEEDFSVGSSIKVYGSRN